MFKPDVIYKFCISALCLLIAACSEPVKLQPLSANATILAFGDSLTYGTGTSRDKAYPARLSVQINREVINEGIPGEVTSEGLNRLPQLLERYQPELIIICHGGNDILRKLNLAEAKANIQQMINLAHQYGSQVVLIGVPEFGLFLSSAPMYSELAEENTIPIENDVLGDILGKNTLKSDHIHPNSTGYQVMADRLSQLLHEKGGLM